MDPKQLIWIQDPRFKITEETSWIPQQNLVLDVGKLFVFGSKKFLLESWIQGSWILDPGSRSTAMDPKFF